MLIRRKNADFERLIATVEVQQAIDKRLVAYAIADLRLVGRILEMDGRQSNGVFVDPAAPKQIALSRSVNLEPEFSVADRDITFPGYRIYNSNPYSSNLPLTYTHATGEVNFSAWDEESQTMLIMPGERIAESSLQTSTLRAYADMAIERFTKDSSRYL